MSLAEGITTVPEVPENTSAITPEGLRLWFTAMLLHRDEKKPDTDSAFWEMEEVLQHIEAEYYSIDSDCDELLRLQAIRSAQEECRGRCLLQLSRRFGQLYRDTDFVAAEKNIQVIGTLMELNHQAISRWKRENIHLVLLRVALANGVELVEKRMREIEPLLKQHQFPRMIDLQRRILRLKPYLAD